MSGLPDDDIPPHVRAILDKQESQHADTAKPDPNYKVGYGRPPKHTRFKKGQPSANGNGRPGKNKAFQAMVRELMDTKVTVVMKGKKVRRTFAELTMQQIAQKSALGDLEAAKLMVKLMQALSPIVPEPVVSKEEEAERARLTEELKDVYMLGLETMAQNKRHLRDSK